MSSALPYVVVVVLFIPFFSHVYCSHVCAVSLGIFLTTNRRPVLHLGRDDF